MEYVSGIIFNRKALCGNIKITKGSTLVLDNDILYYNGKEICHSKSQNAFDHFARNDDGKGKERFALSHEILNLIIAKKKAYDEAVVEALKGYEKDENGNYPEEAINAIKAIKNPLESFFAEVRNDQKLRTFLNSQGMWNVNFYNASLEDLNRLKSLLN